MLSRHHQVSSQIIKLTKSKPTFCTAILQPPHILTLEQQEAAYAHLLKLCLQHCKQIQSRRLFDEMPQRGRQAVYLIHAQSITHGFESNGKLGNAIVDLHAKCGNLAFAQQAFNRLEHQGTLSWNSILSMYSRHGMLEHVVQLFCSMQAVSGVSPNQFTYAIVLSVCARLTDIVLGRMVHCVVMKTGFVCDSFCVGSLVDLYAKCGFVDEAFKIFDGSVYRDTVLWTAMIAGYVQGGFPDKAIQLFKDMLRLRYVPDQVAFVTVITACVESGRFDDARCLFDQMCNPNVVAWNVMISGHARYGFYNIAIDYFQRMISSGVKPTRPSLGSVLSAIASTFDLDGGSQVHAQATKLGLGSNVYVGSSLVNMYAKCQEMSFARSIFDTLDEKNIVLWNTMLGGYAQNRNADEVIYLFVNMRHFGFVPDEFTYTSVLSASAYLKSVEMGKQLHSLAIKNKFSMNLFVGNALVYMYAKSSSLEDARKQFSMIENRDNVSWNAIIVGLVQEEEENEAFSMFQRMRLAVITPDEVCFASMLSACANIQSLAKGKQLHSLSIKFNMETSLYAGSSLVDMYSKCGVITDAQKIFSSMPEKSITSFNALIHGYVQNSITLAISLFMAMPSQGLNPSLVTLAILLDGCNEPSKLNLGRQIHNLVIKYGFSYDDEFLAVSLSGMYFSSRVPRDAMVVFSELPKSKSTVLWTAVLSGLAQNDCSEKALEIYQQMRRNNSMPDQATFVSILKACAALASLQEGPVIHSLIFHTGFDSDELTCSGLVDMYAKCGDVASSSQVFKEILNKKDVIIWNSMIVGYGKNGFAENALQVFNEMKESNVMPDDITFLGVLTACSHAGKVTEGRSIFDSMINQYKIQPRMDHISCMVDLLGRWGYLKEAEEFINKLEFIPNAMLWTTFLGACRVHGDERRGKRASEELSKLEPESSASFVLLSNIYAASGHWDRANFVRMEMKEKKIQKHPGCSWR
uniref:pentatricopeptide repeat-containing protein At3g09040, mitochondrial n=1 Tax=Erigeron canadensis TaxID=72917 RepID=UPI001CB98357|nr:pentatricopeptide repeat-containing protein At3g09040, mitochondrial [Erigeron canadensis]XP_043617798.1 pentatricopeptide repeat-containing protein At3g09040, mitochondrial [Erigeron canadensis]XP_043617799.1 pentatricopeptide repeat-containing protein At3g09040, mitochondrial [Erigeron canadensis]